MGKDKLKVSSPASTGAAGAFFEQHVNAYWLAQLLVGGIPPVLVDCFVVQVDLQTEHLGWHTDDFLITCNNGSGRKRRLVGQVKKTFTVSASDQECEKAISDFWHDFKHGGQFFPADDRFVLVTQRGTNVLLESFGGLLDCARSAKDGGDFEHRLTTPGFLNAKAIKYCDELREIVGKCENATLSRGDLWPFLRLLHVLSLDLSTPSGQAEAGIKSLLAYATTCIDGIGAAETTWNSLLVEVSSGMPEARRFAYNDLPQSVRERHSRIGSKDYLGLKALKDHSAVILRGIVSTLGSDFHLERPLLIQRAIDKLDEVQVVLLSGPAGAGKSTVAKAITDYLDRDNFVYSFRAEEFAYPHFDSTLQNSQIPLSSEAFAALLAPQDRKVLLIESIERLLEKSTRDAFTDLLQLASNDRTLRIILTCRDYSTALVRSSLLEAARVTHSVVDVPLLSDAELNEAAQEFSVLKLPLSRPTLRRILRNPYALSRALQIPWPSEDTLPESEREFRSLFWREIVRADHHAFNGMPNKRELVFVEIALRRARSLTVLVSRTGFDDAAVESLRKDSLVMVSGRSTSQIAPAHDILEDWALLHWINEQYESSEDDILAFCNDLGPFPAVRRAYRRWVGEIIEHSPERADRLFADACTSNIPAWFRDDTVVSFLRADSAPSFLQRHEQGLLVNGKRLLYRFVHLLRVACVKIPEWLEGYGSLFTIPDGTAWAAVLGLIENHLEVFGRDRSPILLGLIEDWAKGVSVNNPYPPGMSAAAAIAFWLVPNLDNYRSEDSLKRTVAVIAKIPAGNPVRFEACLCGDSSNGRSDHATEELRKIVLTGFGATPAARDFPEVVISVAERELLCTKADLEGERWSAWFSLELETLFGIKARHLEYYPASAFRGPMLPLLQAHPAGALAFLAKVFNHTANWYAHPRVADRLEPAYQISLTFSDGTTRHQWCNARLWNLYRGTSVGPDVLQSFLMALERWLLDLAGKQPNLLDEQLITILRDNECASVTAVTASVAVAHPHLCGETLLVLLSCPDCLSLDIKRMVAESHSPSGLSKFMPTRGEDQVYEKERETADALKHRRSHLEVAILNLQTGPYASRVQELLERHRKALPALDKQTKEDRVWRLSMHRMDLRQYAKGEQVVDSDGSDAAAEDTPEQSPRYVHLDLREPEPDVQQMVQKSATHHESFSKRLSIQTWGMKSFFQEARLEEAAQWSRYLEAARSIDPPANDEFAQLAGGGPGVVGAVCVRDHWDEMTAEEQSWCAHTVTRTVLQSANHWNEHERSQRFARSPDRSGAFALSNLIGRSLEAVLTSEVRLAFAAALTHPITEVRWYATYGVAELLWSRNPHLAKNCIFALAAQATAVHDRLRIEDKKRYDQRTSYDLLSAEVAEHVRARFWTEKFPEVGILETDPTSWILAEANTHLLTIWSKVPEDRRAMHAFAFTAGRLAESWTRKYRYDESSEQRNYEADSSQSKLLQEFLMRVTSAEAETILQPILAVVDEPPNDLYFFILGLIGIEDIHPNTEQFWFIWKLFAARLEQTDWLVTIDDRHSHGAELLSAMFLCTDWKEGVRHWRSLEGHEQLVHGLFEKLPLSSAVFHDYITFLYHVGDRSLPDAFVRIADRLRSSPGQRLFRRTNTVLRLETLLRRYVYGKPFRLKRERKLREAVLYLLDLLVEEGSSAAFLMRDDFVTPLPLAIE
jgi:hypothetical protein